MSVDIRIQHAVKKFGNNVIIKDLSVNIKEGEFFTLLGPSGCGKTTLLRMIAGFNSIEGGDFYFNDKRINDIDPSARNIGMVFQNYAIFPNMNVRDNVAFGLKNRKVDKAEIAKRTDKFMELMHIKEYADRMPDRLSGGQQQRVALARALVIEPDVLLMDEPLSNLDAKLRVEMRSVIKDIQHTVGITNVYVTHDQEEAMAVSDRIAVISQGDIQQIGTPKDIYQRPANLFVATFIGRSNILNGEIRVEGDKVILVGDAGFKTEISRVLAEEKKNQRVKISVRPEEFILDIAQDRPDDLRAIIDSSVFLGLNTHYFAHTVKGEPVEIIQESQIDSIIPNGTEISLSLKTQKINIFDADGSHNLLEGVRNDMDEGAASL